MNKIITFYILLTLKDLEFLNKNNFTELPFNEIPFTLKKESIEKFAETSIEYTENILVTARVDCDWIRFSEYKEAHPDENPTEFGRLSEMKTKTFNYSLIDKIKIENVFGKDLNNSDSEKIISILEFEESFLNFRLTTFLNTNSRDIIPADYFDMPTISEDENERDFEEIKKKQEKFLEKAKEITSKINTVDEAVDYLIKDLSEEDIQEFKNKSSSNQFYETVEHFGYGMYLRNFFIYNNENKIFLENLENYDGHYVSNYGEFGEGIIGDLLWRRLNKCETTDDNNKKVKEIQKQIENTIVDDLYFKLITKMKLISYNFKDEEIEKYFDLEDESDKDEDKFYEYYYRQKALLARLNEEETKTFENIKQDYFNVQNVINKLKT